MHGVNPKKLLPIAAAFMFSASASNMSIPMNAAYSAENEMSITADSIIPDGLYSIKNVNSGKYLSQRYGHVLQLSSLRYGGSKISRTEAVSSLIVMTMH